MARFGSETGAIMKDLMKMMKQAQEIQGRMQKLQEDLASLEVEGQSGAGLVTVRLNAKFDARSISIDPSLLKPEEAEILEDLIVAAFQDAKGKAEAAAQTKIKRSRRARVAARPRQAVLTAHNPQNMRKMTVVAGN
jgi:DNA-binding YbaB/EbfC family protein